MRRVVESDPFTIMMESAVKMWCDWLDSVNRWKTGFGDAQLRLESVLKKWEMRP